MTKSKFFLLTITSAAVLNFTGCDMLLDVLESAASSSGGSSGYETETATESKTWDYSSTENPIYEIDPSVKSVTISNIPTGKTMYLVKRNTGSVSIDAADTRGISSNVASRSVEGEETETAEIELPEPEGVQVKYFIEPELKIDESAQARSVTTSEISAPVASLNAVVGSTTKTMWVDCNTSLNQYTQRTATLLAEGTYCYVWFVSDDYTDTLTSTKKKTIATNYASSFDELYLMVKAVFGAESEKIINLDSGSKEAISSRSPTGQMVNIVVYDIGADYNSSSQCGVLGYFYSKDYYYSAKTRSDIIGKSNVGKYFYVDAQYASSNYDMTVSTLAHEFQHMINFNQKYGCTDLSGNSQTTNYNEMLSMLCEDMMQDRLAISDHNSPKGRFQNFNGYYWISGINEYRSDGYSSYSYATSYAFASWLVRKYGGAKLVNTMSINNLVNMDSVVAAVNSCNGTSYTYDDLFEQFLLAITGSSTYTYNADADETGIIYTDGYTYPMTAFDPWSEETYTSGSKKYYIYSLKGSDFQKKLSNLFYSDYDFNGPLLFKEKYSPANISYTSDNKTYNFDALRPEDGISIHKIGTTSSGSKTINFITTGASTLKMYLIIQ